MTQDIERLRKVLRDGRRVVTRAFLWKIPHNSRQEEICLKLGRYNKGDNPFDDKPECLQPKSELTLQGDELIALIDFLREHYEPFRQGVKAFVSLDEDYAVERAAQIRAIFTSPDKQRLIDFVLAHDIIPEDLTAGLQQAQRMRAIDQFEAMLGENRRENDWQNWFMKNSWILGSEFVRIVGDRRIDVGNIADFLLESHDGFLDIVEIKRPEGGMSFWASTLDHGNYIPSADLTKAITQASRYIFEVEREANSVKFRDRVDQVRIVKPRCILIFGRSCGWNEAQIESYRILNAGFHNLTIMTFDQVLSRARHIVGVKF